MNKKISLMLAVVMVFSTIFGAFTQPIKAQEQGDDASFFKFDEATGTITGFTKKGAQYYNENGGKMIIPGEINGKSVTAIGNNAFEFSKLTSVTILDGVTTIGDYAFHYSKLTSVTIPGSVTTIGMGAFSVNLLTSVTLSDGLITIGNEAFKNNGLTSITIPDSITTIKYSAFENNRLTSVTIPNSVTEIGSNVFKNNQLTSVTISDSVTMIGHGLFANNQLTSITIPDGVTIVGSNAFENNQLTSVTIPDSVIRIHDRAFQNNQLTSVTISDGVNIIETNAFRNNQLTSITIPNSVTRIDDGAFQNNQLTSVTIPDSVTTINHGLFSSNQLTSVTIPDSIKEISGYAFYNNQLTSVTIPDSVTEIGELAFSKNKLHTVKVLGDPNINSNGAFNDQEAEYRPKQNPFYENHFGFNGNQGFKSIPNGLKYDNGEFVFDKNVDSVELEFDYNNGMYQGKMTIFNSNKYSVDTQTDVTGQDIDEKDSKINDLAKNIKDLENKIKELENKNKDLTEKIAELEREKSESEKAIEKLTTEKEEKQKEIDKLKEDLLRCPADETQRIKDLEDKINELEKEKKDLEDKLNEEKAKNKKAEEEKAKLEKELEDAKKVKDDVLANAKEEAKKEIGKNKDLTDAEKAEADKKIDDAKTVEEIKDILDEAKKKAKAKINENDSEYLKNKLKKLIEEAKRVRYPSEELEEAIDEAYDILFDRYSRIEDYKYAIENLERILQNRRDTRRNRFKLDVDDLNEKDEELTGKTETKWYIDVYNGKKRILSGQANYKGDFAIDIKKSKIKAKDTLKVVATDPQDDKKYKEVEIEVGGDSKETKDNKPTFDINDLLQADGSKPLTDLAVFPVGKNFYNVVQNGQKTTVYMDVTTFISGNRTMLPIRYIAYTLGFNVEYDSVTREAIFSNTENSALAKKTIWLNIDTGLMRDSAGRVYSSDVRPVLINNRIHASIANIARMFEASQGTIEDGISQTIEWDNARKAVYVFKNVR